MSHQPATLECPSSKPRKGAAEAVGTGGTWAVGPGNRPDFLTAFHQILESTVGSTHTTRAESRHRAETHHQVPLRAG